MRSEYLSLLDQEGCNIRAHLMGREVDAAPKLIKLLKRHENDRGNALNSEVLATVALLTKDCEFLLLLYLIDLDI